MLSFCDPLPHQFRRLLGLSNWKWQRLLYWLDTSGLALYFLDHLRALRQDEVLPPAVRERLQQNLIDNTKRTSIMIQESVAIQREFQEVGISYATLKGFSLCPISVPREELRHQFDLDFLVAEKSIADARVILERRGYRLYAISGKSWEFKIDEKFSTSMKDLYQSGMGRAVELHVEAETPGHATRLDRASSREFYGIDMPVLSPVDLLLGQGMHAFKDVCSAFSRTAHLLEFRRHVLARFDDHAFWRDLQKAAQGDRRICLGLGVVTYLITHVMGEFAPVGLTEWTVDSLPPTARLWVDLYGRWVAFGKAPGSKLYVLLQQELETAGVPARRSLKKSLLPSRLPPMVIRGLPNEKLSTRLSRYRVQVRVIFSRLRFHVVEGLRYAKERRKWRHYVSQLTQG